MTKQKTETTAQRKRYSAEFKNECADHMMGQQQRPEFLLEQLGGLAPQYDVCLFERGFHVTDHRLDTSA